MYCLNGGGSFISKVVTNHLTSSITVLFMLCHEYVPLIAQKAVQLFAMLWVKISCLVSGGPFQFTSFLDIDKATAQNRLFQLRKLNSYVVLLMYSALQALLHLGNLQNFLLFLQNARGSIQTANVQFKVVMLATELRTHNVTQERMNVFAFHPLLQNQTTKLTNKVAIK